MDFEYRTYIGGATEHERPSGAGMGWPAALRDIRSEVRGFWRYQMARTRPVKRVNDRALGTGDRSR